LFSDITPKYVFLSDLAAGCRGSETRIPVEADELGHQRISDNCVRVNIGMFVSLLDNSSTLRNASWSEPSTRLEGRETVRKLEIGGWNTAGEGSHAEIGLKFERIRGLQMI
jgi:hypothetical protein